MSIKISKILLCIISTLTVVPVGCRPKDSTEYHTIEGSVWHTSYHICYRGSEDFSNEILATLKEVELSLSPFNSSSLISRINSNDTDSVDNMILTVFEESRRINEITPYYDPTVGPLLNLWGFGHNNVADNHLPSPEAVDSCLRLTGINNCIITDGKILKVAPGTQFNFSSITKGYGCDRVGEMLRNHGITDYMVEIGGEIALSGKNPAGQEWRIMIDSPIEESTPGQEGVAIVSLSDCGVATSGNYRNFKNTEAGRIGHTISPVTGYPQLTSVLSTTVIAPTAMLADALATAIMATPDSLLYQTLNRLPKDVDILLILDKNAFTSSDNNNSLVNVTDKYFDYGGYIITIKGEKEIFSALTNVNSTN